jgi:hypothetical protein
MVQKSLLSAVILGICCFPAASFTLDSSSHHVRLDRLIEVVSVDSPSSETRKNALDEQFSLDNLNESSSSLRDLPPVLQQITDERRNFQMNLGKAMDTLRKDMPYILKNTPGTSVEIRA